jgi:hypothetical protein
MTTQKSPAHGVSAHTPGPWEIAPQIANEGIWIERPNAKSGEPDEICHCTTATVPEGEATANARLIAAAPDLLTFAHNVIAALEENGADANLANMLADAKATIAKAEGRP